MNGGCTISLGIHRCLSVVVNGEVVMRIPSTLHYKVLAHKPRRFRFELAPRPSACPPQAGAARFRRWKEFVYPEMILGIYFPFHMENTLSSQTAEPFGQREYAIALATFERIRSAFPSLTMNLDLHPENVELAMDIPAQPGLRFKMGLNLQNLSELHVKASVFWMEWCHCTKPGVVDRYFEAVSGLLSGEFRILEHWRGRRPVKAQLQRPNRDGWKRIGTWGNISAIVPWPPKTFKIVQNVPPTAGELPES